MSPYVAAQLGAAAVHATPSRPRGKLALWRAWSWRLSYRVVGRLLREELATQMDESAQANPATGTVYIGYSQDGEVWGQWVLEPGDPATILEEMPEGKTLWDAVSWGRERAAIVLLRLDDPWGGGVHWFVGEVPEGRSEVEFLDPYPERDEDGHLRGTSKCARDGG